MTGQQTFSDEHWEKLTRDFAGALDSDTMRILYRASYSATFGADLRAMLEQIVKRSYLEGA